MRSHASRSEAPACHPKAARFVVSLWLGLRIGAAVDKKSDSAATPGLAGVHMRLTSSISLGPLDA